MIDGKGSMHVSGFGSELKLMGSEFGTWFEPELLLRVARRKARARQRIWFVFG